MKPKAQLHKNLTELMQEYDYLTIKAAVDSHEDDLTADDGPDTSLSEALLCVLESNLCKWQEDA